MNMYLQRLYNNDIDRVLILCSLPYLEEDHLLLYLILDNHVLIDTICTLELYM